MSELVIANKSDLVSIADVIRSKSNTTNALSFPQGFIDCINNIQGEVSGNDGHFGEKLYSFGALSDPHITTEDSYTITNFNTALSMYENMDVGLVCIAGDITDTGEIAQMNNFNSICADHPNMSVHFCGGNHDRSITDANWISYFGHQRNYEFIHNDDVFLFLSLDYNTLSYTQGIEWVRERLNRYKGARIFLFMHFPPSGYSGLTEGQYYGFSASDTQDDELITLLTTTKNVTVFHGHTHYTFDVQNDSDKVNVYRFNASDVNLIHIPSTAYTRDKNMERLDGAEGWLVDVYEKGFCMTGYDIITGEVVEYTEYMFATDNIELPANAIIIDTVDAILQGGESVSVNVYLAEPENTTINISANSALTVSPSVLTFTESNYDVPQVVTISAPANINDDANYKVTYSATGMAVKTTSITVTSTNSAPMLASSSTWYKGSTPRANITEINVVDSVDSVPSTYSESWDASDGESGTITAFINGTKLYIAGNGSGGIAAPVDSSYLFSDSAESDLFSSVTAMNGLTLLNTSSTSYMSEMFRGMEKVTTLDISNFNTTSVTRMDGMFNKCKVITSLDLSNFNTANVSRMYNMFKQCLAMTSLNLSSFNTANVNNMASMFEYCESLTTIDLSSFNTSKVERMSSMFAYCGDLTSINFGNNFNTSKVTTLSKMFIDCVSLTSINISTWNTSLVDDMSEMFDHCDNLTTLDISTFDTRAITTTEGLYRFARKSGITNLTVGTNFVQDYNMYPAGSSGMFYSSSSLALRITGANSVLKTYDFATDNRTVTFAS